MHGVTDSAFRRIAREHGAHVVVSEFTSVDGIAHGAEQVMEQIRFHPDERPYVAQVFGNEPERFATAARFVESLGADGIDINFGCPAPKVVSNGSGCSLYRDLGLVRRIVEATVSATGLPVSVKTRTGMTTAAIRRCVPGYDADGRERITVLEFLEALRGLPIAAFALHARTYEQGFAGKPDFTLAAQAVAYYHENFDGVALINGGITTPADAARALQTTGADGVAFGRAALGNPWLFAETRAFLAGGSFAPPSRADVIETILRHAQYAEEFKGARGITELRKHLGWYVKGWQGASDLRSKLVQIESRADAQTLLGTV
jgi:tRNA-dihydrouridine synthase B